MEALKIQEPPINIVDIRNGRGRFGEVQEI